MPAPSVLTHKGPADGATQLKDLGLLAGRKLLLADDSVTIQKVIELTFADEGVRVVAFNNGQDAIERLEEEAPDIVLADVFMPSKSGYEVCEYVKQNEKLKHIPVMLLVGSFEPFDEAEARRVGADDILTKPFQSIRRLIDRVGSLVTSSPSEKEVPTAELPRSEDESGEDSEKLNTEELEMTTADTMPLPEELQSTLDIPQQWVAQQTEVGEKTMDSGSTWVNPPAEDSDVLLDLGEFETASTQDEDEFVLELDDEAPKLIGDYSAPVPVRAFVEPQVTEAAASAVAANGFSYQQEVSAPLYSAPEEVAYEDQVHEFVPDEQTSFVVEPVAPVSTPVATPSEATSVAPGTLSQELIDAIARRVVEMMSDKVVQEIAWEVVPELAELMIKRQLEQKESQHQ